MDDVISTALVVVGTAQSTFTAVAVKAAPLADPRRDAGKPARRHSALLCQEEVHEFDPKGFEVIEGEPIVYWWTKEFLERYGKTPKLGQVFEARQGLASSDNTRFLRKSWEVRGEWAGLRHGTDLRGAQPHDWAPYVKGAAGRVWQEPLDDVIAWHRAGLALKAFAQHLYGSYTRTIKNEGYYFEAGVAFAMIGAEFSARAHRYRSVIADKGSSVYGPSGAQVTCQMNSSIAREVLSALNPTVSFQVGDVNRLPLFDLVQADEILERVEGAFTTHEAAREPSVEFKSPGPSPWRHAQAWAQLAVDRPERAPLPPYEPELDPPEGEAFVSFAIGVALGRFGANGEGILNEAPADALPGGILFVTDADNLNDSLKHPAAARIETAWNEQVGAIAKGKPQSLRDYLRKDFFAYHKALYENRPIYFPLSSEKRAFVAYVSIHRWQDNTLQVLLADHLHPLLRQMDGEIVDVNRTRASSDKRAAAAADKQYATIKKLRDELFDFIGAITEIAERGAGPTDAKCPPRKSDAPFRMDLDDGVMINSAALWPLLKPQWKDPEKWWKQLCQAEGKKDYDWAHLARRYFPQRVEEKCKTDPSLGVAHGCFWKYHPAKAYAWELRLQDEIRPDFTIDEPDSDVARTRFLQDHAAEAAALRDKELQRRARKAAKQEAEDELPESDAADVVPDED